MNTKPEKEVKRKFVTVPLTEEQHAKIKSLSNEDGRKMADYIRRKALGL